MIIKYIIEILAICLFLYGMYKEDDLIKFEDDLIAVSKWCWKKYVLKEVGKK